MIKKKLITTKITWNYLYSKTAGTTTMNHLAENNGRHAHENHVVFALSLLQHVKLQDFQDI